MKYKPKFNTWGKGLVIVIVVLALFPIKSLFCSYPGILLCSEMNYQVINVGEMAGYISIDTIKVDLT